MALDRHALDDTLTRRVAGIVAVERPLHFRLGDAYLPAGTAPPADARLRCCTCGFGDADATNPAPCPLCGSRAWELFPSFTAR